MGCFFRAVVEIDESFRVWHWNRRKPFLVRHAPFSEMSFSSEHTFGNKRLYIHLGLYSLLPPVVPFGSCEQQEWSINAFHVHAMHYVKCNGFK